MRYKKLFLILLCLISLVLAVLSLMTLMASEPGGENIPFVSGNPPGLYITTVLFLLASAVWYLVYRTRNRR